MDYQLSIPAILRRTAALYGNQPIVSRRADRRLERYTYADALRRSTALATALHDLGVRPGDRVATLCWNHSQHLEAHFGVPSLGAVLHPLNPRLHADELGYIVSHAADRVLIVDRSLWPSASVWCARSRIEHVIVIGDDRDHVEGTLLYERLLAAAGDREVDLPEPGEDAPAAMYYSSGASGRSKGVVHSHRELVLHAMSATMKGMYGLSQRDTVMPIVPMYHASAWGLPYASALCGAGLVLPGPHLDAESILGLLADERVTLSAAVPAVWLAVLHALDATPDKYALGSLRSIVVGGTTAPDGLMRGYGRHDIPVVHAWGTTETLPLGAGATLGHSDAGAAPDDVAVVSSATLCRPAPFVEMRVRIDGGSVAPRDGTSRGELEVRGPWVPREYFANPESCDRFTADGWFRTGDFATIDARGNVALFPRDEESAKARPEWHTSFSFDGRLLSPNIADMRQRRRRDATSIGDVSSTPTLPFPERTRR